MNGLSCHNPLLNLSAYFEYYRQEYYDRLLAISQFGQWEERLRFFFRGVRVQSDESVARVTNLQGLRSEYEDLIRSDRNPRRMAEVVDFLFTRAILTTRQMAENLNMPFKTAGQYIGKLVRAGILREATGYARNRIYRADTILRNLEGLTER